MHLVVLTAHSWLRWAVLALGALAVASAFTGGSRRRALPFVVALDLQLLLGLALWAHLSPLTQNLSREALANRDVRQFAAEHPVVAVLAVVLAHAGSVVWKRGRQRPAAFLLAAALAAAAFTVPWSRPLLRM